LIVIHIHRGIETRYWSGLLRQPPEPRTTAPIAASRSQSTITGDTGAANKAPAAKKDSLSGATNDDSQQHSQEPQTPTPAASHRSRKQQPLKPRTTATGAATGIDLQDHWSRERRLPLALSDGYRSPWRLATATGAATDIGVNRQPLAASITEAATAIGVNGQPLAPS